MTTDPTEVDDVDADDLDEDFYIEENSGQAASSVGRDMIQNNNIHNWLGRYRAAHELSEDFVRQTIADFVERSYDPNGMSREAAVVVLRERRHVILMAEPGTGRRTAAVGLLGGIRTGRREIPIDADVLRLLPVDEVPWSKYGRCAYLLTVPQGCRDERLSELLIAYRQTVEESNSYLVVLVDKKALPRPDDVPGFSVLRVSPPDCEELLRRRLSDLRAWVDVEALLRTPPLPMIQLAATPRQIVDLADCIRTAAVDTEESAEEIVRKAIQAYRNWDDELVNWFDNNDDPRTRLFLVALAFLQKEPATYVLNAAEKLATMLGEPADVRGGIVAPGIRQLAKQVSARVDDQRRIEFTLPDYNVAVLRYLHGDRPTAFRKRLWDWASELPIHRRGGSPNLRIATRVADAMLDVIRALPRADAPEVRTLAERWWGYQALQPLVVELITTVSLSPEAGQVMRERLNQWARQLGSQPLCCAIAAVCGGPLADAYPRAALTRLNHLAVRSNGAITDEVVKAVRALWGRPQHREMTLHQIVGWAANEERRGTGVRALAAISGTREDASSLLDELAADTMLQTEMVCAFARLFTGAGPQGDIRDALFRWLDVASRDPSHEELLASLLVRAGGTGEGASYRFARLGGLLFTWQPTANDAEAPEARDLRGRLDERLRRADPIAA